MNGSVESKHAWRSEPGSYLLLLEVASPLTLVVGRLGRQTFPAGRYAYTGSALGTGGVAARLNRHLRLDKPAHWHIDYLTAAATITGAAVWFGNDRRECEWAQALQLLGGALAPAPGFGSSDCRAGCQAHLWRLPDDISLSWIEDDLTRCRIQAIWSRPC